jgi:hypothetical protein
MSNLILAQIIVYLFVSPLIITLMGGGDDYRLDLSVFFLLSFIAGLFFVKYRYPITLMRQVVPPPLMKWWLKIGLIVLTILYIFAVVANGLVVRRQGSEVMAGIYANLPFFHLLIIRVYEVIFFPVLVVVLIGFQRDHGILIKLILFWFFIGFVFTGVLDSRAKLIIPLLFYYVIFIAPKPRWRPIPTKHLMVGAVMLGLMVFFIGLGRVQDFNGLSEYIIADIVERVDGLLLLSKIEEVIEIPFWGTFDVKIFLNFVALFPFLEGASVLKEMGLTSSKSYYLQVILGSSQFDHVNSVITDLYYFGGYLLLILGSYSYGYFTMRFDISVKSNSLWESRVSMAFMLSFLINALRIEQDFFAILINIARDFFILYFLFIGLRFHIPLKATKGQLKHG